MTVIPDLGPQGREITYWAAIIRRRMGRLAGSRPALLDIVAVEIAMSVVAELSFDGGIPKPLNPGLPPKRVTNNRQG